MTPIKNIKKFTPLLSLFFITILIIPIFANAASIVPCGGYEYDENNNVIGKQPECNFDYLLKLVNNIIDWIIKISVPVAAGVFAWAGFKLMTSGVVDEKAAAKEMLKKVLIGFVIILSAWIIVTTITNALLSEGFKSAVPVEGVK